MSTSRQSPPGTIKFGAAVAILQCLVAFGFAVFLIVSDFTHDGSSSVESDAPAAQWIGTGTAVFMFIVFGTVLAGALSLLSGRSWGRSPVAMMCVLLLPISWYMASEGQIAAGVATALSAILGLVGMFHPQSTEWIAANFRR